MNADQFLIAFLLLLASSLVSRAIGSRAIKKLSAEKKAQLLDLFSGKSLVTGAILIGMLLIFYFTIKKEWIAPGLSYGLFLAVMFVFIGVNIFTTHQRLKVHEFPIAYIRLYLISWSVKVLGLVVFLLLLNS